MTECVEQRYYIKFCQKRGDSKAETIRKIQQAFGDDAMCATQIKEWFNRFKDGHTHWQTVTNVPGGHQQGGMQMSLIMCAL
jgi:hypothetical protein